MSKLWQVVPMGGLANRLRAVLSWRSVHKPLEILWARSEGICGARFLDVFEPLDGVTFTDVGDGPAQDYTGPCDVPPTCGIAPSAKPGWTESYQELRPLPALRAQIGAIEAKLGGPYYAIHARRTDHTEHSKLFGHHTTNDELASWLSAREGRPLPLYLATDCPDTLAWFRARFQTHWHVEPKRVSGYDKRAQSLAAAVVDMWVCAAARQFHGSWISSYSETIDVLRCKGRYSGGFDVHVHMPSADAESYRGKDW